MLKIYNSNKTDSVERVKEICSKSSGIVVAHYHGLTVKELTSLRQKLREKGASFKIVKNTLSKIALEQSDLGKVRNLFSGPTGIAYSEDPTVAAKVMVEFSNINTKLKIIGGLVLNAPLDFSGVKEIAELPSVNELRAKIIGVLQAPMVKVVGVLQAPASNLSRVIAAYSEKK